MTDPKRNVEQFDTPLEANVLIERGVLIRTGNAELTDDKGEALQTVLKLRQNWWITECVGAVVA
jgi:hypothetical protein